MLALPPVFGQLPAGAEYNSGSVPLEAVAANAYSVSVGGEVLGRPTAQMIALFARREFEEITVKNPGSCSEAAIAELLASAASCGEGEVSTRQVCSAPALVTTRPTPSAPTK